MPKDAAKRYITEFLTSKGWEVGYDGPSHKDAIDFASDAYAQSYDVRISWLQEVKQ